MNETRITAYALNELQGGERDRFEADLASDQNLQSELAAASRVADGLAQVMSEPGEGLEPQARQKLLRAIAVNQQAFRQRRKIVRFAVPFSLAAAASIAVLLWVAGGMTTRQPAVAAADGEEGFTANISSNKAVFTFSGDGQLSSLSNGVQITNISTGPFLVEGIPTTSTTAAPGRTISLSESGRAALEMRADGGISLTAPVIRTKPLLWSDNLPMWGDSDRNQP